MNRHMVEVLYRVAQSKSVNGFTDKGSIRTRPSVEDLQADQSSATFPQLPQLVPHQTLLQPMMNLLRLLL